MTRHRLIRSHAFRPMPARLSRVALEAWPARELAALSRRAEAASSSGERRFASPDEIDPAPMVGGSQ